MRAALREARKGLGATHPNPTVGAVIVAGGKIVARGWHHGAGQPHAEIEALRAMKKPPQGATLYVTLEPCSTHGRTPPCTEAITSAGIRRVVYGATDPNPSHAGRAFALLTSAGVRVTAGVLEKECAALNTHWNKWIATGLPYVIAKAALTLDGRISSHPESRWISNERSRRDAMELRANVQAVLVGGGTVRADNPRLTVRGLPVREQPWRVVWTKEGHLPRNASLFTDEHQERTLVIKGCPLRSALKQLASRGVASLLIEGGGRTLGEAFDKGLVDEARFYLAPLMAGGPTPAVGGSGAASTAKAWRLADATFRRLGNDVCLRGQVVRN